MSLLRKAGHAALDPNDAARGLTRVLHGLELDEGASSRAGRYELVDTIAAGAFGRVFRARDPELQREVAVKVISLPHVPAAAERCAVQAEAQVLASLSHPNIVSVFDVFTHASPHPFADAVTAELVIVMELVDGQTLDVWVREEKPSRKQILGAYLQAGAGLAAAHRHGIIHRDFKPQNAMRRGDGRVLVLDFGLALPAASTEDAGDPSASAPPGTSTRRRLGTPLYMPPEQHAGLDQTPAVDVYAFATALFEALYGSRPFTGPAVMLRGQKLAGPPTCPPDGSAPDRLYEVLAEALSPSPDDRPSMRALLRAIRASRVRRLWPALVGAALLGSAIALASGSESECDAEARRVAREWAQRRGDVERGLARAAATASARDEVLRRLGDYVARWQRAAAQTCARETVGDDGVLADRARRCLTMAGGAFLARIDQAIDSQDAAHELVRGAEPLPELAQCSDEELVGIAPLPTAPAAAQQVDALVAWVRAPNDGPAYSTAAIDARIDDAYGVGHGPTTARVLTEAGIVACERGDCGRGTELFEQAYLEAVRGGADRIALNAALFGTLRPASLDKTRHWAGIVFALSDRLRDADRARAGAHVNLARALAWAGRVEEAIEHAARGVELSRRPGRTGEYIVALNAVGALEVYVSEYGQAAEHLEEALELARQFFPDDPRTAHVAGNLAMAYRGLGRFGDAERLLRELLSQSGPEPSMTKGWTINLALVVAETVSRRHEALQILDGLERELARPPADNDALGLLLAARGQVLRKLGRLDDAEAAYRSARLIFEVTPAVGAGHPGMRNTEQGLADVRAARERRRLATQPQ